jgi:signal transduction histidine kinase/FixJ family two-component response regulator
VSEEGVVLVVDDEIGVVRLCQRLLERSGFQVYSANLPSDGLSTLERERVDLLLVDIRMPGADGFQIVDQARRLQPELAVVIMTGFGTVETAIEALRRGADGLVLKPFAGAELVQSVKRALQESQNKRDVLRLQALRPLFDISETLFTETNLERLQEMILETICGHLRCAHSGLYQRQEGEKSLRLVSGRGISLLEEKESDGSILGSADQWGIPLCVSQEGRGELEYQKMLSQRGLASAMVVPVAFRESGGTPLPTGTQLRSRSVFVAARDADQPAFRQSDLEMFVILARQADVALENARLHTELRANIRQLEDSQRALIQAEKLAAAGRLTTSIAHEINNPLQAVQNCLHLAGRNELNAEERQNYLGMAQSELERLMKTVQRMLDFYRPGAVDRKPTDLNGLVDKVLSLLEKQLEERKIGLQTRLARHLPPVLLVGDQIQQVLLNLILNAMEAMPEGGDLFVETTASHRDVEILIEDTGPGFPPEARQHLFEPFISTKEKGVGLGLSVSFGIIAAHGGNLDLVPGRGRGACFRITLPRGEAT